MRFNPRACAVSLAHRRHEAQVSRLERKRAHKIPDEPAIGGRNRSNLDRVSVRYAPAADDVRRVGVCVAFRLSRRARVGTAFAGRRVRR
jgi:hypothetical protein